MNIYFKLNLLKESSRGHSMSRREIRKILHPTLTEGQLPKEEEPLTNRHLKLNTMFSSQNKLKVDPKYYSRYKEFAQMPQEDTDKPIIANSSPYITEEELRRKEYLESKKEWIAGSEFKSFFNKASKRNDFIANYVTMTPSDPPMLHKFRCANKNEWISHNFKF